jgi:uncharacterized protein with gpF-like domain
MHTDEYATPTPTAALPQSFGNDFNLIRAVEEYGPQRVESIRKELEQMEARKEVLTKEMHTLERMIAVTYVGSADRDTAWAGRAWAMAEGHPDAYTTFTERMQDAHNGVASQGIVRATPDGYAATALGNGFEMD